MIASGPPNYVQILVNAGLLVEGPMPELICATRIGTDRAIVRFTDGSSVEREL